MRQPEMKCPLCRATFIPAVRGRTPRYCSGRCRVAAWRRLRKLRAICAPPVSLEQGAAALCEALRAEGEAAEFARGAQIPRCDQVKLPHL